MTKINRSTPVLFVGLFFLFCIPRLAAHIVNGNALVKLMREYEKAAADFDSANKVEASSYLGYVMGVFDATEDLYDAPGTITAGQIGDIVAAFLKRHPERWDESAALLVMDALKGAFPLDPESREPRNAAPADPRPASPATRPGPACSTAISPAGDLSSS